MAPPAGWWPSEVARYYGLPADRDASGQRIGVIAVGGGFNQADLAAAATAAGVPEPTVLLRRGVNAPGVDPAADEELALDLQVLAGVAPGARLNVYVAQQTLGDIASAIAAAAADALALARVLVICWGSSEDLWPSDTIAATEAALRQAEQAGVTVVAASGDLLASGGFAGEAHVFYPASSSRVLACGGTDLVFGDTDSVVDERVWNEQAWRRGTGGGISRLPRPGYQAPLAMPPPAEPGAPAGRGVPDVSALAGPTPGWRIVVGGVEKLSGGTSAAAPLWAGLLALANAARATPLGPPHGLLYDHPELLRPIVSGNNRVLGVGYDAGPGWNACTGLGVPRGAEVLEALVAAP